MTRLGLFSLVSAVVTLGAGSVLSDSFLTSLGLACLAQDLIEWPFLAERERNRGVAA